MVTKAYFGEDRNIEFKGISRDIFIDQKEFAGPIQEQVDEAYSFALRHINMGANIDGLYRSDSYELPITAIREMIANAVLHRSYLDRACIQLSIFDDRIEVISPGTLYGGLDIATAMHGKSTCRNEAIAESFHYMKIVEAWGTGIPRIISRCREYGLPEPLFQEFGDGFMVTMLRSMAYGELKAKGTGQNICQVEESTTAEFEAYRNMLEKAHISGKYIANIELVFEKSGADIVFGQSSIMKWLNCSKSKATNIMNAMKEADVIEQVGGYGPGRYIFIKK